MPPVSKVSNRTTSFEYGGSILYPIFVGCSPMFDSVHPNTMGGQIPSVIHDITWRVFLEALRLSGHKGWTHQPRHDFSSCNRGNLQLGSYSFYLSKRISFCLHLLPVVLWKTQSVHQTPSYLGWMSRNNAVKGHSIRGRHQEITSIFYFVASFLFILLLVVLLLTSVISTKNSSSKIITKRHRYVFSCMQSVNISLSVWYDMHSNFTDFIANSSRRRGRIHNLI